MVGLRMRADTPNLDESGSELPHTITQAGMRANTPNSDESGLELPTIKITIRHDYITFSSKSIKW
ncbi:16592_t:CDS:2 [Funneliformis mosseae]|uniref:16592_t:CDS:1 n=1 Tax=Funneliformis mosseae TaxID=27381 RepID=A0A9N9H4E6_FUNMO|nr:16592_t:CDS:2 [Funneliformis mosseae]